jgi:polar amino acid transport system substrate-binding protein
VKRTPATCLHALGAALALCAAPQGGAQAACSRAIKIPVSLVGGDINITADQKVSGVMGGQHVDRAGAEHLERPYARGGNEFELALRTRSDVGQQLAVVQTLERDGLGEFVAITSSRVAAVGLRRHLSELGMPDDKLSGSDLINVVRGYDYGPAYRALLQSLREQHRLEEVTDPLTAARKLGMGRAGVILIAPGAFAEAAEQAGIAD